MTKYFSLFWEYFLTEQEEKLENKQWQVRTKNRIKDRKFNLHVTLQVIIFNWVQDLNI